MKEIIFNHWSFIRFIRLGLGIAILIQSIAIQDSLFTLAGIIFTAMPIFNIGCCGGGVCSAVPPQKQETTNDITYDEVH
jgi:hypothetical protein